ncbi:hypothetical protein [Oligoflexus tunisiensis]|uniref:hypothetical protein n=1 Tax=Oligoflexus tunisiensis TaxID=708132 RepID=UPI00114CA68C|nr:hypothetical protein [Oligoflexus tunisiensis]
MKKSPNFVSVFIAICFLFLCFSCKSTNSNSSVKATIDPDSSDFTLGRGIDLLTGEAKGDCVDVTGPAPSFDSNGKQFTLKILKMTSSKEIFKSVDISTKAKYGGGFGSVKGKASFTESVAINAQSLYLLITVQVTNPLYTMTKTRMLEDAVNIMSKNGNEAFRSVCGDEFVRSYVSGGEFIALLEIQTDSDEHKKKIDASLKGSYGAFGGSASFSSSLEEAIKKNKTQIYVYQSGGVFSNIGLSADELINRAKAYPDSINKDNAKPIIAYTASYKTLLNFPADKNAIDIRNQDLVLRTLADNDLDLSDLLSTITYPLTHQDQYESIDAAGLNDASNRIKAALNKIREGASKCLSDYRTCSLPEFVIPEVVIPARKIVDSTTGGADACVNSEGKPVAIGAYDPLLGGIAKYDTSSPIPPETCVSHSRKQQRRCLPTLEFSDYVDSPGYSYSSCNDGCAAKISLNSQAGVVRSLRFGEQVIIQDGAKVCGGNGSLGWHLVLGVGTLTCSAGNTLLTSAELCMGPGFSYCVKGAKGCTCSIDNKTLDSLNTTCNI